MSGLDSSSPVDSSSGSGYAKPPLPFDTCEQWEKQLLLVEGQPAEIIRSFSWRYDSPGWSFAGNQMLVCPRCQRIWAYLDFGQPKGQGEPAGCLWPTAAFCERCPGDGRWPAGSILIGYSADGSNFDLPLLFALPEPLLRREMMLHFREMRDD